MSKAIVLGGAGYLGQRVCQRLFDNGREFTAVDPNIYGYPTPKFLRDHLEEEDVRSIPLKRFDGASVVYLVSPHDFPKEDEQTRDLFHTLMVDLPAQIAARAQRLVYLSSATVELKDHDTLYRHYKRVAEQRLLWPSFEKPGVCVVRPGTLYGDLAEGWANRLETVPNHYGATGMAPDDYYSRRTARVETVAQIVAFLAYEALPIPIHVIGSLKSGADIRAKARSEFFREGKMFEEPRRDLETIFRSYYRL